MRLRLPLLFVALSVALPARADDPDILLIGNSYTAGNDLAGMLAWLSEAGVEHWTDVATTAHAPGGRQLWQHLADADGSNGDTALRDLLVTGGQTWTWVTIQEQSQIPGFPPGQADYDTSIAAAVTLDDLAEAAGAQTVLFMTWGRRLGDSTNPEMYPDFPTMQDRLAEGYLAYAAAAATPARPVTVAPVGEAFRTVWDDLQALGEDPTGDGTLFSDLYTGDGSHASPAGTYLAACVLFASMTGRSPLGVPWGPDALDEATTAALQEVAHRTVVERPFEDIPYAWARDLADYAPPPELPASPFAISGTDVVPLVRVTAAHLLDAADVGVDHAGVDGEGRLLIAEGGELTVEGALRLGPGGRGELVIEGGLLEAATIEGPGEASMTMTGGELATATVGLAWRQDGGRFVPQGPTPTSGAWTLGPEAGLELSITGDGGGLIVDGEAQVQGAVVVDVEPGLLEADGSATLIQATTLTHEGAVEGPAGVSFEVVGQSLVASWEAPPADDDDQAQDDDDSATADDDDGVDDDDSSPQDDDDSDADGSGCGCAAADPGGPGLSWLALLAVASLRGRR